MRSEPAAARGGDDSHGNEPSGWPEFLRAWLRNPAQVGAVWPSSPRLSAKLARIAPGHGAPVVVELGPGTGAVTAQVARRLSPEGRHLAVELDPRNSKAKEQVCSQPYNCGGFIMFEGYSLSR